ncbi:transposase DDE domain protein [Orientia tsutsugamushi str. Gilliam]|uniref:Transposase n=1 Tax=Orientia tsutsugamushi str. Gilliam TaxID=1359184 RepID=A0A0F3MFE2_ORITS|nr:transposase [Orientia tsutsugamushi]KJV53269.1 transposase DDE domain protein [Orientia tsutsugamushi str. Gilliam]SPR12435.1 transposase [Orientia tsutsugamushi str. Gilliam]
MTIINNKGEIMTVKITKANKSDLSAALVIAKSLSGKLFADKAYILSVISSALH